MRLFLSIFLISLPAFSAIDYVQQIKPLLQTNCVKCHGATSQKGDLKLDTAAAALKGGKHGPALIAGKSAESTMIAAIEGTHAEISKMPYKRPPLDSEQVTLIKRWIDEGAHAPKGEKPSDDRHWAFNAPKAPTVPKISNFEFRISDWNGSANAIDAFIAQGLHKAGIEPSKAASPETLIRRVYLDVLGLPPTPDEVQHFVSESIRNPQSAIRDLIIRVLNSPHYGERWGRWWLDQARYADSNGYSIDAPRTIWPYRDWVIKALNDDMSFDQFTIEQLAGDLLPNATVDQKIATGFHRNTQVNGEGGIDPEQFRIESVIDRVNTTSTVWLGLTLGCCQCHDHKFDPFPQTDYYRFYAFFNNCEQDGHGGTKTSTVTLPPVKDEGALQLEINNLRFDLDRYFRDNTPVVVQASEDEKKLTDAQKKKLSKEARAALATPYLERTMDQQRAAFEAVGVKEAKFVALNKQLKEREAGIGSKINTLVMQELPKPRETHLFIKGDFTRPDVAVTSGTPGILPKLAREENPTRLDLAKWVVSRENPLTARVIVNRIWQQYFGRGLVETENDFGTMGSAPSHPELLDWLAVEFMKNGWSVKALHRLILTSETYRQTSAASDAGMKRDPRNYLLWHMPRLRLDAEAVRDVCLSTSGLLQPKMFGPPVYPPIPEGVMSLGQVKRTWPASKGDDRYRRGIYTFIFRATPPPSLSVFDAPEGFSTCTRRIRSNTPLQALTLLNDNSFDEFARALGTRLMKEAKTPEQRIEHGFMLCMSRKPGVDEMKRLLQIVNDEPGDETTKWRMLARVLLNLDETITRD